MSQRVAQGRSGRAACCSGAPGPTPGWPCCACPCRRTPSKRCAPARSWPLHGLLLSKLSTVVSVQHVKLQLSGIRKEGKPN